MVRTRPLLLAACLLLGLPCGQGFGQTPPPSAAPQVKAPVIHHVHRRRRRVGLRPAAPAPVAPPAVQAGSPGTSPAPVPNEDVGPPRAPTSTSATVDPGNLSIHYPPLGQGYLPGSSPQDMANTQTPKVPGVTVNVPLQQKPPQTLPPPDAAPGAAPDAH